MALLRAAAAAETSEPRHWPRWAVLLPHVLAAVSLVEDTADTPEETVLKEDRTAQLRRCLAQMSREHREVIDLVYYHEKSVEEVAEIIRLPKNTVKTRMFYARKRLAQLLASHQDFGHLAAPQAA